MKGFIKILLLGYGMAFFVSCATSPDESEIATESAQFDIDQAMDDTSGDVDEFTEFKDESGVEAVDGFDEEFADEGQSASQEDFSNDDFFSDSAVASEVEQAEQQSDQDSLFTNNDAQGVSEEVPPPAEAESPSSTLAKPSEQANLPPAIEPAQELVPPQPVAPTAYADITNIQFKANDNGGTVVIAGTAPLSYTTRSNPDLKQFIIEIQNARLPEHLKRPFPTRDFQGPIGAINAYQNHGGSVARVVVQLINGAEPTVHSEGNSILMVATPPANNTSDLIALDGAGQQISEELGPDAEGGILSAVSLGEFLAGNMKFYGKKISIEFNDMELRDAITFIAEESGVNMILSDEVKGKVSVKLRQVPWDQALVVLMRTKGLGYTRQGNVLRITSLDQIYKEEEAALKIASERKVQAPFKVQMIPVSYADIAKLQDQVKPFLTPTKGQVVSDSRTGSLIITDTEEVIERVSKLVSSLDLPPPQVLIEGKIVEARETFNKDVGVQWSVAPQSIPLGGSNANMRPSLRFGPEVNNAAALGVDLAIGTLDVLGDLTAVLRLQERLSNVKVLSSPRIVTLNNEAAEIMQSTQIPVPVTTSTASGSTESIQYKPINMSLNVTPQITNEGSVIMTVDVKREVLGAGVGSTTPPINTRSAKSKVLVKNGQTAVIGGVYQNDTSYADTGIPWLKEIPILGYLFRSHNETRDKTELLIFITPRILSVHGGQAMAPAGESSVQ